MNENQAMFLSSISSLKFMEAVFGVYKLKIK